MSTTISERESGQVECRSMTASYGLVPVCRDLSLTVASGEALGIIGPNGAGKSTLAKALAGLVAAQGEVSIEEEKISDLAHYRRPRRGWITVTDDRALFRGLSVGENLELGLSLAPIRERSSLQQSIWDRFPVLRERKDVSAGLLSGGEQQMLAIAKALCAKPRVMVLDEPSQGLAPSVISMIADVLRQLRESNLTVILAEQNIEIVREIADKYVVLVNGTIVDSGDTASLDVAEISQRFLA